ncbi:hypothetical protein FKG96_09970 [Olivibacter sp. LS-1]|uniref:hypothetical protein n=1 Tax=Olivibacter sp. LS-1 TaxID=2592345 RepID=UPI0011EA8D30|nr:hypothetical protein [Olivibacter sp. LS-1]QEL01120.1 hypothetical protein FKG96_09970 [Olivibacter sp. LS-1]
MNQEKSSLNNNYRQKIDERAELFDGHEKTVYKCGYKDGFIDCEEYTAPLREELEKLRAENDRLKAVNISLEKTIENMAYLEMDTDRQSGQLIIENAQYKEALELVKLDLEERGKEYWDIYKIAKEALKGGQGEKGNKI